MSTIKQDLAQELADVFKRMDDLKAEAAAIAEVAKDKGFSVKALRKVAREINMDSEKLAKQFEDESQLEMFRLEVGLLDRKGFSTPIREAAE